MRKTSLRRLVARLPVDPDVDRRTGQRPSAVAVVLIAIGGSLGALLRGLAQLPQPALPGWPWATLLVNMSGSAALAFLLVCLARRFQTATWPRPLLGTGVLGGYTTFSTFAVGFVELAHHGRPGWAVSYLAATTLGCLLAASGGLLVGRAVPARPSAAPDSEVRRLSGKEIEREQ